MCGAQTSLAAMTNTLTAYYRVTPTEPDGDITSYAFANADDVLDYVAELAAEYGYNDSDIDGTDILGYCTPHIGLPDISYVTARRRSHGSTRCGGHVIGSVRIVTTEDE
jgi:hypothetical protein